MIVINYQSNHKDANNRIIIAFFYLFIYMLLNRVHLQVCTFQEFSIFQFCFFTSTHVTPQSLPLLILLFLLTISLTPLQSHHFKVQTHTVKCASFLEPIYSCSSSDLRLGTHFFFFLISLCLSLSLFQCSLFCFGFLFYFLVIFDAMGYSETQEGKKNNEHGENWNTFFFLFFSETLISACFGLNWTILG